MVSAIADSSGGVIGYAEVARDGTERMYLEQNLADAHDRMRALAARLAKVGHAAADRVLCELAALLRSRLRAYDVPIRYGGDEMVVLLPDTNLEGTLAVADKILQGVRDLKIRHQGQLIAVTISAGVAAYPLDGSDPESILRAADRALYRAKAEGRDRVVVAEGEASPVVRDESGSERNIGLRSPEVSVSR